MAKGSEQSGCGSSGELGAPRNPRWGQTPLPAELAPSTISWEGLEWPWTPVQMAVAAPLQGNTHGTPREGARHGVRWEPSDPPLQEPNLLPLPGMQAHTSCVVSCTPTAQPDSPTSIRARRLHHENSVPHSYLPVLIRCQQEPADPSPGQGVRSHPEATATSPLHPRLGWVAKSGGPFGSVRQQQPISQPSTGCATNHHAKPPAPAGHKHSLNPIDMM